MSDPEQQARIARGRAISDALVAALRPFEPLNHIDILNGFGNIVAPTLATCGFTQEQMLKEYDSWAAHMRGLVMAHGLHHSVKQ